MTILFKTRIPLVTLVVGVLMFTPMFDMFQPSAEAFPGPRIKEMRRYINQARRQVKRPKLRLNRRLSRIARRHSVRMSRQNNLHHNRRLAYQARNIRWRVLGENVGVGATVRSLHRAFMNSAPHRRNIRDRRFKRMGIGIRRAGGRTWVTVIFAG